ncbi:MAG: carboxylating nicotinate-nucleotide diphosphorylase [Actinomycetes bacterium]
MNLTQVNERLASLGLDPVAIEALVRATIAEDLDGGVDVTTVATVPAEQRSQLDFVAHAPGVLAGVVVAQLVFAVVAQDSGATVELVAELADGSRVADGDVVLSVRGTTRDLLTAERTALNLLGPLSGVATATAAWADLLDGSVTKVRDTRKTTPLLRSLQKYAVRCGGGVNHRMSLSDAALIKDNHVVAAGGVTQAFAAVRRQFPGLAVEVEVDSLEQLDEVVDAGADLVLLDNFTVEQMAEAVRRVGGRARLEASGGLTLADAAAVATTGVDYVAVGALTHSAPVLDIGADLHEL